MRKKLVVGNWKMNLNQAEAVKHVEDLNKLISASPKMDTVICPSFIALAAVKNKLEPLKLKLGAQNCHYLDHGAFTGEVSPSQLRGLVDYVIVGHSERRLEFSETSDVIARKVSAAVRNGLTPILCVGENLFERQDDETARVLQDQLATALVMLTTREVGGIVVAYEPVWAVDSEDIATPDQVKVAVDVIRKTLQHTFGDTAADAVRVLYGGHMEPDSAASYFAIKNLDGFLVGRASLNAHDFGSIVKATQRSGASKKGSKVKAK